VTYLDKGYSEDIPRASKIEMAYIYLYMFMCGSGECGMHPICTAKSAYQRVAAATTQNRTTTSPKNKPKCGIYNHSYFSNLDLLAKKPNQNPTGLT